jgi:hypothetical protein
MMFRTLTAVPARLIVVLLLPAPLNVAVSATPGMAFGVQFVVVFQAVLVAPFHVGSPPAGGGGAVFIAAMLAFVVLAATAVVLAPPLTVVPAEEVLALLAIFVPAGALDKPVAPLPDPPPLREAPDAPPTPPPVPPVPPLLLPPE